MGMRLLVLVTGERILAATSFFFLNITVLQSKLRAMLPGRGKGFGPKMYDFSLLNQYKQLSTH